MFGKLVKNYEIDLTKEYSVNCSDLSTGIYFVHSLTENNKWLNQKIIVV